MNLNEPLARQFYTVFGKKDYSTTRGLYAEEATYIFRSHLSISECRGMWEMPCKNGK